MFKNGLNFEFSSIICDREETITMEGESGER
jgi:hypothetical protein